MKLSYKISLILLVVTTPLWVFLSQVAREYDQFEKSTQKKLIGAKISLSCSQILLNTYRFALNSLDRQSIEKHGLAIEESLNQLSNMTVTEDIRWLLDDDPMKARGIHEFSPFRLIGQWNDLKPIERIAPDWELKLKSFERNLLRLNNYVRQKSGLSLEHNFDANALVIAASDRLVSLNSHLFDISMLAFKDQSHKLATNELIASYLLLARLITLDFEDLIANLAVASEPGGYGSKERYQQVVKIRQEQYGGLDLRDAAATFEKQKIMPALAVMSPELTNGLYSDLVQVLERHLSEKKADLNFTLLWTVLLVGGTLLAGLLLERSLLRQVSTIFEFLKILARDSRRFGNQLKSESAKAAAATSVEASAIQESVAAMSQMSAMIAQTNSHIEATHSIAKQALDSSQVGANHLRQVIQSMTAIAQANGSLKDITNILEHISEKTSVINDIAFKTQLLAVNAAIESARAGHFGKGFAVVANEVGALASVSGQAANEIREILSDSQKRVKAIIGNTSESVKQGEDVCRDASGSFDVISDLVVKIGSEVDRILEASKEQELGIKQTSQAMAELNRATVETNALSKATANLSVSIVTQAENLGMAVDALHYVTSGRKKRGGSLTAINSESKGRIQLKHKEDSYRPTHKTASESSAPKMHITEVQGNPPNREVLVSKIIALANRGIPWSVQNDEVEFRWHEQYLSGDVLRDQINQDLFSLLDEISRQETVDFAALETELMKLSARSEQCPMDYQKSFKELKHELLVSGKNPKEFKARMAFIKTEIMTHLLKHVVVSQSTAA